MKTDESIPMLIPVSQEEFWATVRNTVREEINPDKKEKNITMVSMETPGLTKEAFIQNTGNVFAF